VVLEVAAMLLDKLILMMVVITRWLWVILDLKVRKAGSGATSAIACATLV
jgi:hypothetical protein